MSLIIEVENVGKRYGEKKALQGVNFSLNQGAPVALVGPNGAGKTTLFSLLCGYIQPTSGSIKILGHKPASSALFGRLAALPQDAQLDPRFSIASQLTFYARLQGMSKKLALKDTQRVIAMVGLQDASNSRPSELSHGMRKRATIAQALLGAPEIVMLDEATAGLDPINAKEVRAIVAEHANDVNFILWFRTINYCFYKIPTRARILLKFDISWWPNKQYLVSEWVRWEPLYFAINSNCRVTYM
jgi:ABC-type multidrug transport system ATPase subunit